MRKIELSWGSGASDLFLDLTGDEPRILDFEYDGVELHERCGGKTYYTSCSGCSGAGYVTNLGALIPVGFYRTDTVRNDFQHFTLIGEAVGGYRDIQVAVPYAAHTADKTGILKKYPTVIKYDNRVVVYCDFFGNFMAVLRAVFLRKELPEGARVLKRTFVSYFWEAREEEVSMEFYDLCSMDDVPSPWEFYQDILEDFRAQECGRERLFELLGVEKLKDGTFVRTTKVVSTKYRGKILSGNPLETGELTAGWQRLADDVLVRFYDRSNTAHLLAYAPAKQAHEKLARRLSHHMGETEEFVDFVSQCEGEYVEYELTMSKALYLLDSEAQLAALRQGLAKKIRSDVSTRARQWLDRFSDQEILGVISDDLVVTFEDSLAAGNCRPGTEEFVSKYFPGQTETTAKKLKAYADNSDVMRVFRHLATIGRLGHIA